MKKIVVLMGGWSAERAVSLESGRCVLNALKKQHLDVKAVDVGDAPNRSWMDALDDNTIVFNALHGTWGEDGTVQGLLESMHIPHTHSSVHASAIAMDKHASASIAHTLSMRVPHHQLLARKRWNTIADVMALPFVIKPTNEGSSVGVTIVHDEKQLPDIIASWQHGDVLMVQQWIDGRELTVGILNDETLDVMEIIPAQSFYDYNAKYDDAETQYHIPATVPDAIASQAQQWALAMHRTMGCSCVSRSDFLFDENQDEEGLYFLEINTQPGLTSHSLLPAMAAHRGISFDQLVTTILEAAQ